MRYRRPQKFFPMLASLAIAAAAFESAVALPPEFNPHEIANLTPSTQCLECHTENPSTYLKPSSVGILPDWNTYKLDGTAMCVQCHDAETAGHEVDGTVIDFTVPADLPLTGENSLMCMTCHYMHGSLSSDRPWASVSFMDHVTNSERLRKSYVLRRNNSSGELCLVCHETNGEKNND